MIYGATGRHRNTAAHLVASLEAAGITGYSIKTMFDEPSQRFWFQLEVGSIYAALDALSRDGYICELSVDREGKRPERTKYQITREGRAHLRELVSEAAATTTASSDPIGAALAATTELNPEELSGFLRAREQALNARLNQIGLASRSAPVGALVRRATCLAQAELDWIQSELKS